MTSPLPPGNLTPEERAALVQAHRKLIGIHGAVVDVAGSVFRILRAHPEVPEPTPEPDPVPDPPPRPRPRPEPEPEPEPRPRPGPDPPTEPRPTGPRPFPPQRAVSWAIRERGKALATGDSSALVGDVLETRAGPLHVAVVWDFDRPTLIASNRYEHTGVIRWESATVTAHNGSGAVVFNLGKQGCMPPRYAIVKSSITPADWSRVGPSVELPGWIISQAEKEMAQNVSHWVGPYELWTSDTDPSDPDLAQHHGGRDDWLTVCPTGRALRWQEAIGAMSRGIWLDWPDPSRRYWWDASAYDLVFPGWKWEPETTGWCAYEQELATRRITDMSHGRAWYGAVAAMAPYCKAAEYMLMQACWPEVRRSYTMDRSVPATTKSNEILYSPLWQILDGPMPHGSYGNRREAHAINVCAEAAPFMNSAERELYVGAWSEFLDRQVDRFGRADFSFTGDAAGSGLPAPVSMHFQQALLIGGGINLNTTKSVSAAKRGAGWWGPNPPYYAHTGGEFRSATAAPHKDVAVHTWTYWTHPETVDPAEALSLMKFRVDNQGAALGDPLDCLPPSRRPW